MSFSFGNRDLLKELLAKCHCQGLSQTVTVLTYSVYFSERERSGGTEKYREGSILQHANRPQTPTGFSSPYLVGLGSSLETVKTLSSFSIWHLNSLGKRLMNCLAFNRFL